MVGQTIWAPDPRTESSKRRIEFLLVVQGMHPGHALDAKAGRNSHYLPNFSDVSDPLMALRIASAREVTSPGFKALKHRRFSGIST